MDYVAGLMLHLAQHVHGTIYEVLADSVGPVK